MKEKAVVRPLVRVAGHSEIPGLSDSPESDLDALLGELFALENQLNAATSDTLISDFGKSLSSTGPKSPRIGGGAILPTTNSAAGLLTVDTSSPKRQTAAVKMSPARLPANQIQNVAEIFPQEITSTSNGLGPSVNKTSVSTVLCVLECEGTWMLSLEGRGR